MAHVFLSYIREDEVVVEKIAAALRRQGVEVWIDRDSIDPGTDWREAIESAINNGAFVIACFSEHFFDKPSSFMEHELRIALRCMELGDRERNWLVPVRLSPTKIPDIRVGDVGIRDFQWVDVFSDFFDGIRKILRIVRPISTNEPETELKLRRFCDRHIESKIARDRELSALRFQEIERQWRSLTFPALWNPTFEVLMLLLEKTEHDARPLTERFVQSQKGGHWILITVAKTTDKDRLKLALPGVCPESSDPYGDFIRHERQNLRASRSDWPFIDMVHWIWTFTSDVIEVDLLYWANFKLMITCWGYRIKLGDSQDEPVGQIQTMYPGSLITSPQFSGILNEIMKQEAELCQAMVDGG